MLTVRDLNINFELTKLQSNKQQQEMYISQISAGMMTPIKCILTYCREIARTKMTSKAVETLALIERCALYLYQIHNDLVDSSSIEKGNFRLDLQWHGLISIVNQVIGMMTLEAKNRSLKIKFDHQR